MLWELALGVARLCLARLCDLGPASASPGPWPVAGLARPSSAWPGTIRPSSTLFSQARHGQSGFVWAQPGLGSQMKSLPLLPVPLLEIFAPPPGPLFCERGAQRQLPSGHPPGGAQVCLTGHCSAIAWLGQARIGPPQLGSARGSLAGPGGCSARCGLAWLGSHLLGSARPGTAQPGSALLGSALAQFSKMILCPSSRSHGG